MFMIWEHGEETLLEFFRHLNSINPSIQFENPPKYSKDSVEFLDVKLTRVGDKLKTDLYTKTTDTHQYLEFSSCHPYHIKRSIPYSQTLRLRRICSEDEDFLNRVLQLRQWLYNRGYDKKMVDDKIKEASRITREDALKEKNLDEAKHKDGKDVLVLTYHPALPKQVHKTMNKYYQTLSSGEERTKVFSKAPIVAYRQPKSLKDILVRAIIKCPTTEPNVCSGCNDRSDCQVCQILVKSDIFYNMDKSRTYNLRKGTLHCNSSKVVYLLSCETCSKQYVGKTKGAFRERFNNYKSKFRKYFKQRKNGTLKKDEPVQQAHLFEHFIQHDNMKGFDSGNKKHEDWSFWSFQLIDSSPDENMLLERESFWIYQLGVFHPKGLNEREVPQNE